MRVWYESDGKRQMVERNNAHNWHYARRLFRVGRALNDIRTISLLIANETKCQPQSKRTKLLCVDIIKQMRTLIRYRMTRKWLYLVYKAYILCSMLQTYGFRWFIWIGPRRWRRFLANEMVNEMRPLTENSMVLYSYTIQTFGGLIIFGILSFFDILPLRGHFYEWQYTNDNSRVN